MVYPYDLYIAVTVTSLVYFTNENTLSRDYYRMRRDVNIVVKLTYFRFDDDTDNTDENNGNNNKGGAVDDDDDDNDNEHDNDDSVGADVDVYKNG